MKDWNPEELGAKPSGPGVLPLITMGLLGMALGGLVAANSADQRTATEIHVDCQVVLETAPDTLALVLGDPRGTPDCLPYWRAKLRAAGFTPAADSTPAEVAP